MIFALGALVSALLTLLFLPALWRRATRLSLRQLEMRLPLSMDEIVAERDQLRAEFAAERRRIEQRLENVAAARAQGMEELGRRVATIYRLEGGVTELRGALEDRETALARRESELASTQTELGAAHQELWSLSGRLESRERAHEASETDRLRLVAETMTLAERVAAGEAAQEAARVEIAAGIEALQAEGRVAADHRAAATALGDAHDHAKRELASATARRDALGAESETRGQRIAELEELHREERRLRARAEAEAAKRALDLADERRSSSESADRRVAEVEAARVRLSKTAEDLDGLRSRNAALEGALDAARRELSILRNGARSPRVDAPEAAEETAILRRSIAAIGDEVARLTAGHEMHSEAIAFDAPRKPQTARVAAET